MKKSLIENAYKVTEEKILSDSRRKNLKKLRQKKNEVNFECKKVKIMPISQQNRESRFKKDHK